MSNLIPFESAKLPAHLQAMRNTMTDLTSHVGSGGFPVLSIKGKVFTLVKNDERTVITRPDDPDEAASALEVVILRANNNLSKVWYANGYEDGVAGKPDCYSNDGSKPGADASNPQCKTCAACTRNAWGSGSNGKGKACSDSRRVAISSATQLNEPMLLRVPPATLKPLAEYAKLLANRGVTDYAAVVTKIRFDREEATPKLTFQPVGFLDAAQYAEAQKVAASDLVDNIIGVSGTPHSAPATVEDAELEQAVAPAKAAIEKASAPVVEDAPAPKPKAAKPAAPVVDVEDAPAPKPKAAKPATIVDDLDSLLAGLDD